MVEYITDKAIVRIHPGKMTDAERKEVITNASETKAFFQEIMAVARSRGTGDPFRCGGGRDGGVYRDCEGIPSRSERADHL